MSRLALAIGAELSFHWRGDTWCIIRQSETHWRLLDPDGNDICLWTVGELTASVAREIITIQDTYFQRGKKCGREQHAQELRRLLDEGKP